MSSVVFYDDRGVCSPSELRKRQHGGSEHHQIQIFEWLVARGVAVHVYHRGAHSNENGVWYYNCEGDRVHDVADAVVIIGCSSNPQVWRPPGKTFAFQVVDPRPHPDLFAHLKGVATMVCVSDWEAELFRNLGHAAITIPVPVPDELYGSADPEPAYDFGCFSSWNKGALQTIQSWRSEWGVLAVGSPYSHPDHTQDQMPAGVHWLGTLQPRETWLEAMRSVGAIARVCTIGETFGVVDVFARAMGINCYTLCTGDVGALREVGAQPFTDPAEWRMAIQQRTPHPLGDAERFRLSRVLPRWLELLK